MTLKRRILFGRNCGFSSPIINVINDFIGIITTIRCDLTAGYVNRIQQRNRILTVMLLTFAQKNKYRISVCIYYCMDFTAGPAPASSDFIGGPPFFAPALC